MKALAIIRLSSVVLTAYLSGGCSAEHDASGMALPGGMPSGDSGGPAAPAVAANSAGNSNGGAAGAGNSSSVAAGMPGNTTAGGGVAGSTTIDMSNGGTGGNPTMGATMGGSAASAVGGAAATGNTANTAGAGTDPPEAGGMGGADTTMSGGGAEPSAGASGSGGLSAAAGTMGSGGSSATAGAPGGGGSGGVEGLPDGCDLPATVSFQQDVQPFLIPSCGGGNGCHVIDDSSTMSSGGYNHAYDWITAGSHTESCPDGPMRFEIVVDVVKEANPASCSNSRKMPPPDETGDALRTPLTDCQIATLQAWLDEPLVTQTHREDDTSPTTPYPMPPFN